ncbi:MAG: HlyC/CorC family transporter [Hyphomicrobiales bacterium]|nr:HlyC/CorC family transporter [Hyphomicrobiales bacterium]
MLQLVIAAILILCNGAFALSELAVVSSRKARLQALAEEGSKGAQAALDLLQQPGRFLSTVQIGITLVGILAGAFSGAALGADTAAWLRGLGVPRWLADSGGYALVIGAITYFSVVIGELVPKHMALRNPEPIACVMAPAMTMLSKIAAPLVWILDTSAGAVVRMLGGAPEDGDRISDEEIRALIAEAARTGVIAADEREMMAAVMRFGDRNVRSVMTPRIDVSVVDLDQDEAHLLEELRTYTHSTVLIADGGPDRISGIVRIRDLLALLFSRDRNTETPIAAVMRKAMRRAPVIPDTVSALQALETLRSSSVPLAVVRDEYGNFEGIVTPADVLDALAGAFRSDTLPREPGARKNPDGSWTLAGAMPVDEMADLLGVKLPQQRGFQTLGGYLIHMLGRIPENADTTEADGWRFTVASMDERRIGTVRASRIEEAE